MADLLQRYPRFDFVSNIDQRGVFPFGTIETGGISSRHHGHFEKAQC
jgi:hypothetical protein